MATQAYPRPQAGILYGLTHTPDGEQIVRLPRTVKVSIGIPGGKDLHVYKKGGKWVVVENKVAKTFDTGREAKAHYDQRASAAPERNFPAKLSYFTFRRTGPDGGLEPDWRAIDAHGDLPTVIDIVFTDRQPLEAAYEMWGGGRRKCWGDGHNALRALDLAGTPEEKALAKQAEANGERYFPIVDGCKLHGCPYAKSPDGKKPAPCKPHARLSFQLVSNLQLGGKAEFNTTSYRSISQLYSSLEELTRLVGGITGTDSLAGIPLQFCVRPYTTQHNNKPVKAWGVTLEFRAEALAGLRKKLIGFAQEMNAQLNTAPLPPSRQVAASADPIEPTPEEAEALEAEFYPSVEDNPAFGDDEDFSDGQPSTPSQQAGQATEAKMGALREKLSEAAKTAAAAQPPAEAAPPPPPPPPTPPVQEAPTTSTPTTETAPAKGSRKALF